MSKLFSHSLITFVFLMILLMSCKNKILPAEAALETSLQKLTAGNSRFSQHHPVHPDEDINRMVAISKEQHPFAAVICCSDSRVPPELLFDQGFGDLFVIRTAGNIIGGVEIGSIEYAVEHLGVKLIIVMGHENCGAVKAFIAGGEAPGHIKDIVDSLKNEQEIIQIPATDVNRLDDCVVANVWHGVKELKNESAIIREKIEKNELQIVAARYDLDDFKVTLLKQ